MSNKVTIPERTRRLIKVDTVVWSEAIFSQIRREMNISIAGIVGIFVFDFKVYTAVYCELSMTMTSRGKAPLCVLSMAMTSRGKAPLCQSLMPHFQIFPADSLTCIMNTGRMLPFGHSLNQRFPWHTSILILSICVTIIEHLGQNTIQQNSGVKRTRV